ncbi:hypothetical protein PT974_11377 [Cladobotryum mycophilum]|uniref:C2H2-type domain-containing protein n=1 Tax=Cladobotryum mycophilum TaxID=491253 RepID=A0ABR0S539_9HYPO
MDSSRRHPSQFGFGGDISTASYNSNQPVPWNLINFYESDSPWHPPIQPQTSGTLPNQPLNPLTWGYRSGPLLSDGGTYPGDSGYGGSGPTMVESVSSIHEDDTALDTRPMENLLTSFHVNHDEQFRAPGPVEATRSPTNYKFHCLACNTPVKTKSELNKHAQRHNKPHKCTYLNCNRAEAGRGFSTPNDLARHLRTVHKEHDQHGPVYICKHGACINKKLKIWPRADNFRCHLSRSHDQDVKADDDLKQYIYQPHAARRHELQGIGQGLASPVADMDTDGQALQLQDSSPLRSARVLPNARLLGGIHQEQGEGSGQMNPPPSWSQPAVARNSLFRDVSHQNQPGAVRDTNIDQLPILPSAESPFEDEVASETDESPSSQDDVVMEDSPVANDYDDVIGRGNGAWTSGVEAFNRATQSEADDLSISASDSEQTNNEPGDGSPSESLYKALIEARADRSRLVELLKSMPKDLLESVLKGEGKESGKDETTKTSHKCPDCAKSFVRPCELKKHKKRHEKPYGCTFKQCGKYFGSKNDWKRHESSQHFMLETWTCDMDGCQKVRHRRETFKNHLHRDHRMENDPKLVDKKLEKCRMGRHCDPRFWCGFCDKIIEIKEAGINSWTRRCDHIDNHLFGKGGLAKKSMRDWRFLRDDEEHAVSSDVEGDDESPDFSGASRKRKAADSPSTRKIKRLQKEGTLVWHCCKCSQMMNYKTSSSCVDMDCNHTRCPNCKMEAVTHGDETEPATQMTEMS